ncbi:MAG: hypothetical protein O3B13_26080, partial [Planctomycetota bacterium]|nr:hypothetical protein [Planctomycetota bacterium]
NEDASSDSAAESGTASEGEARSPRRGSDAAGTPGRPRIQPENDAVETAFRSERETLLIEPGRRLLLLRRTGLSEAGSSSQEYRLLVKSLQQRIDTAIEVEEIPPGYVSGIRAYFDALKSQDSRSDNDESSSDTSAAGRSSPVAKEAPDGTP